MTERELRREIANINESGNKACGKREVIRLCVEEYLKGKKHVSRKFMTDFKEYIYYPCKTAEEVIISMADAICWQSRNIIRKCVSSMLYIKTKENGYVPFEVPLKKSGNFLELIGKPINSERNYELFKWWFYEDVVQYDVDLGENDYYYVYEEDFRRIEECAPEFMERLKEEGRVYYDNLGYFAAKEQIEKTYRDVKVKLNSMSSEERNKIVLILTRDSEIKVLD